MKNIYKVQWFLFSLIVMFSCNNDKHLLTDTVTTGTITVVADETYQPLLDSEKMVFEAHYPEAHINIIYKPAIEVLKEFDNDSVRMIISSVHPDSNILKKYFQAHEYYPNVTIIAKDAVAIVANNTKKGLKISVPELAKICEGNITNYNQLKNSTFSGKINLVFDNNQSSTLLYIQDSILKGNAITSQAYAQKTNLEVLNYVKSHSDALGIIGVNWVSDNADEENLAFRKDIFPVEISSSDTALYHYSPHQGYIATHLYPMRRYMQSTLKEGGPALGRGFLNFMCGDIGQKIVLKSGLVPAKALTRVVQM